MNIITSKLNVIGYIFILVETTSKMIGNWKHNPSTNSHEIDVEKDITRNAAEIIAKHPYEARKLGEEID